MVRRLLLLLFLAAAGAIAFFVLHHPPMRLMPVPLVFQEGGAAIVGAAPEFADNSRIALFYATNRLPVGPQNDRLYTVAPDRRLHLGTATLRIGDETSTLDQLREWTFSGSTSDRPFLHLENMAEAAAVPQGEPPAQRPPPSSPKSTPPSPPAATATSSSTFTAPTPPSSAPLARPPSSSTSRAARRW